MSKRSEGPRGVSENSVIGSSRMRVMAAPFVLVTRLDIEEAEPDLAGKPIL